MPLHLSPDMKRRAAGLLLTLLVQVLLIAMLLTLSPGLRGKNQTGPIFIGINIPASQPEARAEPQPETPPAETHKTTPAPAPVAPSPPAPEALPPEPPPVVPPVLPSTIPALPAPAKRPPAGPLMGPPAPARLPSDDTPMVGGTGPNGEPLYAAAWYREPYDDELRGYLSTARGPGWGRIACRTVSGYRVEDCIALGESPEGSGIARSVLAAAWQFRVRPPRKGGRDLVGEWVRIQIDYSLKSQPYRD